MIKKDDITNIILDVLKISIAVIIGFIIIRALLKAV